MKSKPIIIYSLCEYCIVIISFAIYYYLIIPIYYDKILLIYSKITTSDIVRKKIPKHVSFIMDKWSKNDAIHLDRVLLLCQEMNIRYVSIMCRYKESFENFQLPNFNLVSYNGKGCMYSFCPTFIVKSYSDLSQIVLRIIHPMDGHKALASTLPLFEKSESVDILSISIALDDIPDPDLVISTEPFLSLHGYPIWSLRLSEIFHIPTKRYNISTHAFIRGLDHYSSCQQRFGK